MTVPDPGLRQRLSRARLYVLVDGSDSLASFRCQVERLVAAGVDVLQLRDKKLCDRDLVGRARILRAATASAPPLFIVNDRPDIALLSNADGVHLGQDELCPIDARTIVGADRLIGVSTHTVDQMRQALDDRADYIGCGPTFPSNTKDFTHFPGIEFLRAVAAEVDIPAFAIGGISIANVDQVVWAGFHRVAVASAVNGARNPETAVDELRARLLAGPKRVP